MPRKKKLLLSQKLKNFPSKVLKNPLNILKILNVSYNSIKKIYLHLFVKNISILVKKYIERKERRKKGLGIKFIFILFASIVQTLMVQNFRQPNFTLKNRYRKQTSSPIKKENTLHNHMPLGHDVACPAPCSFKMISICHLVFFSHSHHPFFSDFIRYKIENQKL
jgi:hypothetical protein